MLTHQSVCMSPTSPATGIDVRPWYADSYSPKKPSLLPKAMRVKLEDASEPWELLTRGSTARAAASARRASAMRASRGTLRSSGRARPSSGISVAKPPSGRPAHGSGAVAPASSTVSSTR